MRRASIRRVVAIFSIMLPPLAGCALRLPVMMVQPPTPLVPQAPPAKVVPTCQIPVYPSTANFGQLLTINGNVPNGGLVTGARMYVSGVNIFRNTLTLIARGDIDIEGALDEGYGPNSTRLKPISLDIVSLQGTVHLMSSGRLGDVTARPAVGHKDDNSINPIGARGNAGQNGGYIRIIAQNIIVSGKIYGFPGEYGTVATHRAPDGRAIAVGGDGGAAGDILLCAVDSISVTDGGFIYGGLGGPGGHATSTVLKYGGAYAVAGSAGANGDVLLRSPSTTGSSLQIFLTPNGEIKTNYAPAGVPPWGQGGKAAAKAWRDGFHAGTDAHARAGGGADGGTIILDGRVRDGFVPRAFAADDGGTASAQAGTGSEGREDDPGFPGGNAFAQGGRGGKSSVASPYTDLAGNAKRIPVNGHGHGGRADAAGAEGGDGGPIKFQKKQISCARGGLSGYSDAIGGPDGAGVSNPPAHADRNRPTVDATYNEPCTGGARAESHALGR